MHSLRAVDKINAFLSLHSQLLERRGLLMPLNLPYRRNICYFYGVLFPLYRCTAFELWIK
jgi:hypothetical protein